VSQHSTQPRYGWLERLRTFGRRQVPVWYRSSEETIGEFDRIGQRPRLLKVIPNPFPLYDWIMGFYERPSDRDALDGPVLDRARSIIDVGSGTGYLLGRLAAATRDAQELTAIDLSPQMLNAGRRYLEARGLLRPRVRFALANCLDLPFPDNSVDLYVSSYPFDLLPDVELRRAILEMERGCIIESQDSWATSIAPMPRSNETPSRRRGGGSAR